MPKPQSFQSHTAINPLFHFVILPLNLINVIAAAYCVFRSWPWQKNLHFGWILTSVILLLLSLCARMFSARVQDRVIRLEERHRIAALVPLAPLDKLSIRQLIALRFASDAELPSLVARTLKEGLEPKAIKQAIVSWRPDYDRI